MEIERVFERSKKRSECSSVEELRSKMKDRASIIRQLYGEKQKEMNFWKSDEAEVSWCDEHEAWCEVLQECSPKDPIPPVVGVHKKASEIWGIYFHSNQIKEFFKKNRLR